LTLSDLRPLRPAVLAAVLAAPILALGQGGPPASPPAEGRGPSAEVRDRMERRMRLARTLGLAETLELDEAETARLSAAMAPFDARRKAILEGARGDVATLRQAARKGDPKALAGVDGAVQRLFDARAALVALDREMFAALSKGMPPGQSARMALFFARFRQRFGMEVPDASGAGSR
jgi:hypothetical protein